MGKEKENKLKIPMVIRQYIKYKTHLCLWNAVCRALGLVRMTKCDIIRQSSTTEAAAVSVARSEEVVLGMEISQLIVAMAMAQTVRVGMCVVGNA